MDVASGFAFGYDPTGRSVIFMIVFVMLSAMVAEFVLSFHGFTDHLNRSIDIIFSGISAGSQS